MPVLAHIVAGKVHDIYGAIVSGVTVTLTHATITPTISATTNSDGEYNINLSGLSSDWSVGESFTLTIEKTGYGKTTSSHTITSGGSQTHNLTFTEESVLEKASNTLDRHNLVFALPTHYDGEKITKLRGLPVHNVLARQFTEVFSYNGNLVQYHGWADPGTGKGEAKWRIQKLVYSGNLVTDIQWASGTQNFDKVWNNRTSYSYK